MIPLLEHGQLPSGFTYPHEFVRIVEMGLLDLEPWYILRDDLLRLRMEGLRSRYTDKLLVPFAARQDNDDVASWEVGKSEVLLVHDFSSPDSEVCAVYESFYAWLRVAIEDLIEFDE